MIIDRLFTGEDGHTHFGQIEVALEDSGISARSVKPSVPSPLFFARILAAMTLTSPCAAAPTHRPLDGEIEVENALGEKRRYRHGDVVLAEDLSGSGHRTKSVDGRLRRSFLSRLETPKLASLCDSERMAGSGR